MSQQQINQYLAEIDRLRKFSGISNEQVIRPAFRRLLDAWATSAKLVFLEEFPHQTTMKSTVYPDGTVLHDIRVPLGYWEAKDTKDDLEEEIRKKFARGYPQDNIIFENSETAVLIQNRQEIFRCSMTDTAELSRLVSRFFAYERPEIAEFRKAVQQFKADLPAVLDALRKRIDTAYAENADFRAAAARFLVTCKETINPALGEADVREMLIQHILTEEIFAHVFNDSDFHRKNNIAHELYALEDKFFTGAVKRETLKGLEPYYAAIRANAAQITSHQQKQTFLKVIYENFYKVYDTKKADRLGVVYTPNEIVRFMIEGADWLCEKHFGKNLIDEHVEILDPATGTGTFVCELLEYFRGDPRKLAHKYKNELHANEVAILPYYVANLNIEATYAAITGQFAEYPNLCFVDTLDNVTALGIRTGQHVGDLFGAFSDENVLRVKRQNARKISVIIGNPPYNANQQNENDNNKNRNYDHVDHLIKDSYIRLSTAQKTKVYDMYARFFRWASDRMHDDGVLAFITNRSFIDSRTFDGFRKAVVEEFNEIYVVDLGGDVRANPKLSGTKNNVFGIQTGVAISFLVKRRKQKGCKIFYARRPEFDTAGDKLAFLGSSKLAGMTFERIEPDKKGNWVDLAENDWEELVPLADKKVKRGSSPTREKAIFRLFSLGVSTSRDEWVYGEPSQILERTSYLVDVYNQDLKRLGSGQSYDAADLDYSIKWTRSVKQDLLSKRIYNTEAGHLVRAAYRPFFSPYLHFNGRLIEVQYQQTRLFGEEGKSPNRAICFTDAGSQKDFMVQAVDHVFDYHFVGAAAAANGLPLYRYTPDGERIDNITDWGLKRFQGHYGKAEKIGKEDIFHYVYAVLHDPRYREKYALNLKREFPRIPFYPDFWTWACWGKRLMELHIGYETVEPWPLERLDTPDEKAQAASISPKAILKADKDNDIIRLDSETQLSGIPTEAWAYRLGNRSGLEWILDQYKEKTPKDPTIREKFNTYRFADYKEKVIDLLMRVSRVSVETVAITEAMKSARRSMKPIDNPE
ncbi:type ISP restriction/modification enzyme [Pseudorhizobium pelagicum]|uniref:type ISP restriction/modification enzyme n=1 Tax=Pseudorhizobium pelagicum TaxID=1509405 RepID=UPI0004D7C8B6|nr:type ISP restriction/modification enzyme [Pseudorhizobium pelagicum]KEQ09330.1 DNA methyltransferase [Pseudorhizobium pelagicum]